MAVDWKELTYEFVRSEHVDIILKITRKIINPTNLPKVLSEKYKIFTTSYEKEPLLDVLNYMVGQYSTFLFPAMITIESGSNFYLRGEKAKPEEQEAWKMLYLILSAVPAGDSLVNIDYVNNKGREVWRTSLLSEDPAQLQSRIRAELAIDGRRAFRGIFFTSLLILSYFIYITSPKEVGLGLEDKLSELRKKYGFSDITTLVIFQLGKKKKEVHYFSKLVSFVRKWYGAYIQGDEDRISLVKFLDSLTNVSNDANSDEVIETREKLVYYLLRQNVINGELLSKLITLRMQDALSTKSIKAIYSAKEFFAKL